MILLGHQQSYKATQRHTHEINTLDYRQTGKELARENNTMDLFYALQQQVLVMTNFLKFLLLEAILQVKPSTKNRDYPVAKQFLLLLNRCGPACRKIRLSFC